MCIESKESVNEIFSPESLVECDSKNMGCNGGYLQEAWEYMEKDGIVTDKCDPYVSGDGKVPQCDKNCADPSISNERYKCKAGSVVEAVTKQ